MKFSLVILFLFAAVSAGYALKCYQCSSTESWDKCEPSKDNEKECIIPGVDRCGKLHTEFKSSVVSVKIFTRGCFTKYNCDNPKDLVLKTCEDYKDADCELNCCSGDLCNAGATPVVSGLLILSCALVALFR